MNKYKVIALIGKAGSGKDTILNRVLKTNSELHKIINCTTRPIREKEKDGVNYFYMTPEEFKKKTEDGEMIEGSLHNWWYGTS